MTANENAHPTRVAIVGAGKVGATYAYALLLSRLSSEIVLIDANRARRRRSDGPESRHPIRPPDSHLGGRL